MLLDEIAIYLQHEPGLASHRSFRDNVIKEIGSLEKVRARLNCLETSRSNVLA
jgi:hypothetical protein